MHLGNMSKIAPGNAGLLKSGMLLMPSPLSRADNLNLSFAIGLALKLMLVAAWHTSNIAVSTNSAISPISSGVHVVLNH